MGGFKFVTFMVCGTSFIVLFALGIMFAAMSLFAKVPWFVGVGGLTGAVVSMACFYYVTLPLLGWGEGE